ncbi:hypothetical protein QQX98_000755 [Neonectria punicea]|uniref:Uncharacterized protein n=1 Tax=Neonectria punicea TaxID=979145 RepID=A0ABR1HSD7_9HYPO
MLLNMKALVTLFLFNSLPGIFVASQNGTDSTSVSCDAEFLNDSGAQAADRWAAAGAEQAFKDATIQWGWYQGTSDAGRLTFSEFIGNYFNSKDLMVCQNMGDGPCESTMTCSDANQPAGFLIMNSFVSLHVMRRNVYEGLQNGMNEMQSELGRFQEIFSPEAEPQKNSGWFTDLITLFQFVVGIGGAYAWNIALKEAAIIANANYHAFAAESVNAAIGMAFTVGKNHIPTASETHNDLSLGMGTLFEAWIDAELEFLSELFNGTNESITTLEGLVKDGLALEITRDLDLGDFVNVAQKIMYTQLMPTAWKISSRSIDALPQKMEPMIMMVPGDCITSGDELNMYLNEDDAAKMAVCHDGHTFYLGYPSFAMFMKRPEGKDSEKTAWQLKPLPGGTTDELDGTKWGGVKLEDLVISAYEGWRLNGGKGGYEIPESSRAIDGLGTEGGLIMEQGVRTPGFSKIPICTPDRAVAAAGDWVSSQFYDMMPDEDAQKFPCGDGTPMEWEMVDWGY